MRMVYRRTYIAREETEILSTCRALFSLQPPMPGLPEYMCSRSIDGLEAVNSRYNSGI